MHLCYRYWKTHFKVFKFLNLRFYGFKVTPLPVNIVLYILSKIRAAFICNHTKNWKMTKQEFKMRDGYGHININNQNPKHIIPVIYKYFGKEGPCFQGVGCFNFLMNNFTFNWSHCPKLFIISFTKHNQFIHYHDFIDLLLVIFLKKLTKYKKMYVHCWLLMLHTGLCPKLEIQSI